MNAILESIVQLPGWKIAGWTMLHYLWLGAVVAVVAAVGSRALAAAAPQVRYAYALVVLIALAVSPIATAVWLAGHTDPADDNIISISLSTMSDAPRAPLPDAANESPSQREPFESGPAPATPGPSPRPSPPRGEGVPESLPAVAAPEPHRVGAWLFAALDGLAAQLPWLWFLGTPITVVFLAAGLVGAERMRRRGTILRDGDIFATCARLAERMNVTRAVLIGLCDRLASPVLVGIVRPMILLPSSAVAGLTPDQLEMILLHELAHVRRWDNLVNLLQRLIEAVLFFQPAVWIVSGWVRLEREHCCDALVVARTGQAAEYARLLVWLADRRAFRAEGGGLLSAASASPMAEHRIVARVRHILKREGEPMQITRKTLLLGLVSCCALVLVIGVTTPRLGQARAQQPGAAEAADEKKEDAATTTNVSTDEEGADKKDAGKTEEPAETAPKRDLDFRGTDKDDDADKAPKAALRQDGSLAIKCGLELQDITTLVSSRDNIVKSILVKPGDHVKAGQKLVDMEDEERQLVRLQLARAEVKLKAAAHAFDAGSQLYKEATIPLKELEKLRLDVDFAKLDVEEAQLKLRIEERDSVAPIDGMVTQVLAKEGKRVAKEVGLVRLTPNTRYRATALLTEHDMKLYYGLMKEMKDGDRKPKIKAFVQVPDKNSSKGTTERSFDADKGEFLASGGMVVKGTEEPTVYHFSTIVTNRDDLMQPSITEGTLVIYPPAAKPADDKKTDDGERSKRKDKAIEKEDSGKGDDRHRDSSRGHSESQKDLKQAPPRDDQPSATLRKDGSLAIKCRLIAKDENVALRSSRESAVTSILVKPGDRVKAGQKLIELGDEGRQLLRIQLAQADAKLQATTQKFDAGSKLRESGRITQAELEKQRFDFDRAMLYVDEAKRKLRLEERDSVAPIDGVVTRIAVTPGKGVAKNQELVFLKANKQYASFAYLTEREMLMLQIAMVNAHYWGNQQPKVRVIVQVPDRKSPDTLNEVAFDGQDFHYQDRQWYREEKKDYEFGVFVTAQIMNRDDLLLPTIEEGILVVDSGATKRVGNKPARKNADDKKPDGVDKK